MQLLRRFDKARSHDIVTLVGPAFGSYTDIVVVWDPTYQQMSDFLFNGEESSQQDVPRAFAGNLVKMPKEGDQWKDDVRQKMRECDLCVIDVSDVGPGLAWEIATALTLVPSDRIVLIAAYEVAARKRDQLFAQVGDVVFKVAVPPEFSSEIHVAVADLRPPIFYGSFPLSWLFSGTSIGCSLRCPGIADRDPPPVPRPPTGTPATASTSGTGRSPPPRRGGSRRWDRDSRRDRHSSGPAVAAAGARLIGFLDLQKFDPRDHRLRVFGGVPVSRPVPRHTDRMFQKRKRLPVSVTSTDAPRRDLRGSMRFCTLVTLDS